MAYRCNDGCNKLCGLDEPELDPSAPEMSDGVIRVAVEANYPSTCCGITVATASYEAEGSFDEDSFEHAEDCEYFGSDEECPFELSGENELEGTDRYQTHDRSGKVIKNSRYKRHYYGVSGSIEVRCPSCTHTQEVSVSDESGPPETY